MNSENLSTKIRNVFKEHLIDSTAILVIGTPISAAMEVGIAGMSDDVSINARLIATGLTYVGMGSVIARGRDLYRRCFGITDKTKEGIQQISDAIYLTALNSALGPVFYYSSGSRDWKEIAIGTAAAAGLSFVLGGPAGYMIDAARDLTNIRKSERIPVKIRNLGTKTKKSLAALALAGSLGLTAGIYGITPDRNENYQPEKRIEQIQENSLENVVDYQFPNELNNIGGRE